MSNDSYYFKVTYSEHDDRRTTLISAPYSVQRIRKILAEIHPTWEIIDIKATGKKVEPVD